MENDTSSTVYNPKGKDSIKIEVWTGPTGTGKSQEAHRLVDEGSAWLYYAHIPYWKQRIPAPLPSTLIIDNLSRDVRSYRYMKDAVLGCGGHGIWNWIKDGEFEKVIFIFTYDVLPWNNPQRRTKCFGYKTPPFLSGWKYTHVMHGVNDTEETREAKLKRKSERQTFFKGLKSIAEAPFRNCQ